MAREDLTDEQWKRLEPLLPPIPKVGRPPRNRRQAFGWDLVAGQNRLTLAGC